MISKDILPFNTVEKEGFLYLMNITAPLYKVPSRKTITKLIEEKYDILSNIIKTKLSSIDNLCLTTDVWTDVINTKSYLGVTAHFILNDKLTSVVIGVNELDERHTSDYLGQWLLRICTEWHIGKDNVVAIVTDNAANIVKAVSDTFGKDKHLGCFAHTLNLVATSLLKHNNEVNALCAKVKALITFLKHSVIAADELRKYNTKKLIQSVPTRWNSTYYMLERFIELSENITIILLKFPKAPPMLSALELQLAKEVIQVLAPIEAVTKEICGEQYVTSSKIIPLINCLKRKVNTLKDELTSSTAIQLLESLSVNINMRFGDIENNTMLAVSTLLDPRFKRLHFNNQDACLQTINKIVRQMENVNNDMFKENNTTENAVMDNQKNSLWSYHNELAYMEQLNCNDTEDMPTDFKHYLNQPIIGLHEDPIHYWLYSCKTMYLSLHVIAKKYLLIVATSVPSERLISKTGNIVTEKRNKLSSEHLQCMLFLNSLSMHEWKIE
ncbi:zinc finger BED domain-containing protein 1-like [Temnothorax curvispinosus]|uniref:Zinc finger BED domain-containing protein 1-like n=1 Tax=Temnothorax curvispinosus TaxID=300111 RepID=A0A6J1Q1G4_9HYME|nr:zinc finger BED domain-containing protein 1-like [Temnothorax curvispinosus]